MIDINGAYHFLSDIATRIEYDKEYARHYSSESTAEGTCSEDVDETIRQKMNLADEYAKCPL